jgi:hypothetical protein
MLKLAQFHCSNRRLSSIRSINAISTICWTDGQLFPIVPGLGDLPAFSGGDLQAARRINKGRKSRRLEPGSGGGTLVHCAPVQGSEKT